ncbi:hypothetical protein EYF80_015211 [Liparis tanakae]|uniref:Uncharacterized protein n=1 Tax=Liparis tanakae TaxID=230148 RepID=A0A4Z2IBF6_9TELE|nr:hypothetical protein EYF80_015211 [Liparis tanakae]
MESAQVETKKKVNTRHAGVALLTVVYLPSWQSEGNVSLCAFRTRSIIRSVSGLSTRGMARGQGGMQDAHPSGLPAWENMKGRRKEGAGGLMLHYVIAKHRSAPREEEESPLCRRSTAPPALMLVEWSQPNTKKPPNDTRGRDTACWLQMASLSFLTSPDQFHSPKSLLRTRGGAQNDH